MILIFNKISQISHQVVIKLKKLIKHGCNNKLNAAKVKLARLNMTFSPLIKLLAPLHKIKYNCLLGTVSLNFCNVNVVLYYT